MASAELITIPYCTDATTYVDRLCSLPRCLLLDSGRPASVYGRYDIFTAAPLFMVRYTAGELYWADQAPERLAGSILVSRLQERLAEYQAPDDIAPVDLPFRGGLAGFVSYDLGRHLADDQRWHRLTGDARLDIGLPDMEMGFYSWAGVIDHKAGTAFIYFSRHCPQSLRKEVLSLLGAPILNNKKFKLINKLESNINVDSYVSSVAAVRRYIEAGDCYQVNYSQRFSGSYTGDPWQAYKQLRNIMPAPFGAYLQLDNRQSLHDSAILSFSPERFLRVEGRKVRTEPIKGTAKRFPDPLQDRQSADALLKSDKNRAENLMIVDLLRNDLGKCCLPGSIYVEKLFELQSHSHVHHLVSTVTGELDANTGPFDLLQAAFPGGSITGTPKLRAAEIINELEPARRSVYCGSIGYINTDGSLDMNIAIRTILCLDGGIHCWGGGGIVADSDPLQEYQESLIKIQGLLSALEQFRPAS